MYPWLFLALERFFARPMRPAAAQAWLAAARRAAARFDCLKRPEWL